MKNQYLYILLFLFLLVCFSIDIFLGSVNIPFSEIIKILFTNTSSKEEWLTIIMDYRLPKALTAIFVGIALSVSGLQMQTIFRNPLAGPYVLGISSGASLGVAILVLGFSGIFSFDFFSAFGSWSIVLFAWIGAGAVLFLIFLVSIRIKNILTILILGIMFGSALSAVVNILQYFSNEAMLKSFIVWTMGSLGGVTKPQLWVLISAILAGTVLAVLSVKILNVMLLGENYARSMGVNLKMARFITFLSTSILAGSVTAFCGPIGFIGIAVPHISRFIFRDINHKIIIWACILIGANMMLISDLISQIPGQSGTLPINSVTALLGIPIVVWIVMRKQK